MTDRRAVLVLNPASGDHDADATEATVIERLEAGGIDVEVRRTEGEGDARRFAAEAVDDGVDVVLVAGGDGSVREVVSGVVGDRDGDDDAPDTAVVILPLGTANLLARVLDVPVDDLEAAAGLAVEGVERQVDVMRLADRDDHAVLMVDAGFDAELVDDTSREDKDRLGVLAYVKAGLLSTLRVEDVDLELELDGEVEHLRAHSVLCVNIGRIGDAVVVDQDIEPDDGLLHVAVVRRPSPVAVLTTAAGMVLGDRDAHPNTTWHRCTRVRVTADPALPVQVDGDASDDTPFEVELLAGAVRFLVPEASEVAED